MVFLLLFLLVLLSKKKGGAVGGKRHLTRVCWHVLDVLGYFSFLEIFDTVSSPLPYVRSPYPFWNEKKVDTKKMKLIVQTPLGRRH